MRKTSIFGHFGPKWAKRKFFEKALGTFFSRLQALTNCKVSEKSNEWFSRNYVTNGRTLGQIWINFDKNESFLNLHRKSETVIFSTPETRLKTKSSKIQILKNGL